MPRRHLRIICFLLALLAPVAMTGLALVGGPWQLMLMLHPGALAYWRLVERRPFRALLYSDGPWGPWALLGLGAAAPAVGTILIHMQSRPDVGAAIASTAPSELLIAVLMAILIGGGVNAIPEEVTLRRIILTPLQERWGAGIAVGVTALMFIALHLPTWINSEVPAQVYAFQVPDKLLFGLVAGWSVVRLRSLFFALGMHLGGNLVGVFLDTLAPDDSWTSLTWGSAILTGAEFALCALLVAHLGKRRISAT